jgi:hypothetical protein
MEQMCEENEGDTTMTERDFTKELLYTYYADMENGDDIESIDYRSLIHIITELCGRIEALESKVANLDYKCSVL